MSVVFHGQGQHAGAIRVRKRGLDLLSQQIWCWGRDILRPEGNWLLEIGFERFEPPADRERCSSVYTLELPLNRRVVLRGFGVFYGDDSLGGIFLPRFEFGPSFAKTSKLECLPWSIVELPTFSAPNNSQRNACAAMTSDLIDWIRSYEETVVRRLGIDYRQSTLHSWDSGNRSIIPAEEMASAWRSLGIVVTEDFQALVPMNSASRNESHD